MNLLSLLGVVFASGTLTLGTPQFRNNDTYQDVEVSVTYEYETNEVNSWSDLVVGNIYKFSYDNTIGDSIYDYDDHLEITCTFFKIISFDNISDFSWASDEFLSEDCYFAFSTLNDQYFPVYAGNGWQEMYTSDSGIMDLTFYFVYKSHVETINGSNEGIFNAQYKFISASDYLGEENITVTPIETSGLYNIFYQFLNDRIFTGGYMDSMTSSVLGQTLTLGNWCSIATSIVCLALVLFVFIKLLIFLFKVVGGLFLWR